MNFLSLRRSFKVFDNYIKNLRIILKMQYFFRRYKLSFIKTISIHSRNISLISKLLSIKVIFAITLTNEIIYNRFIEFKLSKSSSII